MNEETRREPLDLSTAESLLRPSAEEAEAAWRVIVTEERLQVERLPNRPRPEDFYAPVAEHFRGDPQRPDNVVLEQLLRVALPGETWLDLGAGGGRYALPLAANVARVIAVEPSAGMRVVLADAIEQNRVRNIDVFAERWPGPSEAPTADVGMIVQVGYDIEEIGGLLDQLEAHSRRLCIAVLFERAPISYFAPLWQPVHGEKRIQLPGLRELISLLLARGVLPRIDELRLPSRVYPDLEALHEAARRPLWVVEGSDEDKRLAAAVRSLAVQSVEGVSLDAASRLLGIVTWHPA
jgi:SAM-dependent methyltransferase